MTTIFSISKYPVKSITCLLFYFLTFSILKLIYLLKIIKFLPRISLKKKNFKIIQVLRRILLFIHLINNYLKLIEIDPSDEFKDGEGSLLPLWKFNYEKTKKHDVTDLCFNSRYYDLFAVSFGTSKLIYIYFENKITNSYNM